MCLYITWWLCHRSDVGVDEEKQDDENDEWIMWYLVSSVDEHRWYKWWLYLMLQINIISKHLF